MQRFRLAWTSEQAADEPSTPAQDGTSREASASSTHSPKAAQRRSTAKVGDRPEPARR
jgi:hypothetical protein